MPDPEGNHVPRGAFFGRRKGHGLRPHRAALIRSLLPRLALDLAQPAPKQLTALFPLSVREVRLEIGFGGGERLVGAAVEAADVGFIGVEPFINGVSSLLVQVDRSGARNVRVLVDDARLLLDRLPDASVDRAFVLFPDPWPKVRHHKRRIVNPATAAALARVLRPGAELRIASDDPDYVRWILATMLAERGFAWTAERPSDWRNRPLDGVQTRYEEKALRAGRTPVFMGFRRV